MKKDPYIDALLAKLDVLRNEIVGEKQKVKALLEKIQQKEEQAEHILKLLDVEDVSLDADNLKEVTPMSVPDMAYEILYNQSNQEPVHYQKLANSIMAGGKLIPGKDPAANLIAHLGRDDRFVRTGRGMYGLLEWGLEPAKKARVQKRKSSKRKK